jgi:GT2 family glycosyltransferase
MHSDGFSTSIPDSTQSYGPKHVDQQSPLVHILLVNWNAGKHTLACLASLEGMSYPNYKIVVLDNASSDGSAAVIAAAHPDIHLIRLPRNLGFTGANNVGFQYALEHGADYAYLLNTDAHVAPDFLSEAVKTAISCKSIGVVGSKVLHMNAPDTLQFGGGHVNLATGYHGRPYGYNQVDRGQCDHITDVDWVTGCAMLVSRACLERIGGFDDAFFAFHEDVDLCLRARTSGFRVVMSPLSRVWHEGGGSMGGAVSHTHIYYDVRNGLRLVQKHKPAGNWATSLFRTGCIVAAHMVQVALNRPSFRAVSTIVAGTRDYYRGITNARPLGHSNNQ